MLLTGMSGTGKSALIHELRERGYTALDADEDGFSEPRGDGRWGCVPTASPRCWRKPHDGPAFFAGCSEEQADLPFAVRGLLTAPEPVLVERLRTRGTYGSDEPQLAQVLADLAEVEPLLRRSADLMLTTPAPPPELADAVLRHLAEGRGG